MAARIDLQAKATKDSSTLRHEKPFQKYIPKMRGEPHCEAQPSTTQTEHAYFRQSLLPQALGHLTSARVSTIGDRSPMIFFIFGFVSDAPFPQTVAEAWRRRPAAAFSPFDDAVIAPPATFFSKATASSLHEHAWGRVNYNLISSTPHFSAVRTRGLFLI